MSKWTLVKEWYKKSEPTDSDTPNVKKRGLFRQKKLSDKYGISFLNY